MVETSFSLLDQLRERPDAGAWQRLVDIYTPLIHGWLRRRGLADADVDDLTQEVMTALVRELPHFEHDRRRGAFRSWLRTITVHRLRGFWRARRAHAQATGDSDFLQTLDQLEDPSSGLSRLWDQEHDRHVVHQLLRAIEPAFEPTTWQAFRRVVMDDARAATVAAELGISVNAVLLAKSRILRRLRQEMKGFVECVTDFR